MTNQEYQHELRRVRKLKKKWIANLGLRRWSLAFHYYQERKSPSESMSYSPKNVNGVWECAMDTTCDPYYQDAAISIYLPVCKDLDDAQLELTFLHECMHILLSWMHHPKTAKEEELVATTLAQAFVWTSKEGSV